MRQSHLFTKTRREAPKDEVSQNAQLLLRAGFIHKEMAGVYDLLPLGFRVVEKIRAIIREEMEQLGAQEVSLSALQDPELWKKTDRWDDEKVDVWFKTELKNGSPLGLAATHEEPMTNMMVNHVSSYRDLPRYTFQFQTKFRNELRAKSGIMRGREFLMKDMYSFNRTESELEAFYENAGAAYQKVFQRAGIGDITYLTFASGGMFSQYSHEFQTVSTAGEDTIYIDEEKHIAINEEVLNDDVLKELGLERAKLLEAKAIEVGNIFKFGSRYSTPLGLTFTDEDGTEKPVVMGAYGIGLGRLMGTVAEVLSDEKGLVWPETIAPYELHLVELSQGDAEMKKFADTLYEDLVKAGIEVLYDDRDARAGEKFADSDLIGIPYRAVIGKQATPESIEVVQRATGETKRYSMAELIAGAFKKS
ncbi:MAG: prolyl-tRNA synthetase [Patescibacteria group bacterium]|nr:prolyl-tRNA synthetase [Patescibacteria group bacterium]